MDKIQQKNCKLSRLGSFQLPQQLYTHPCQLVSQSIRGNQTITSFFSYNLFLPTIPNHATQFTMPHTIASALCRTQLRAHFAAHYAAHNNAKVSELPCRKWNYFGINTNSSQFLAALAALYLPLWVRQFVTDYFQFQLLQFCCYFCCRCCSYPLTYLPDIPS